MKIYTNSENQIKAIGNTIDTNLTEHIIAENSPIALMSDVRKLCYCYEDNGSFYPFVSMDIIAQLEQTKGNLRYPITLEEYIAAKLTEISSACEQTIFAGLDLETTEGTEHFSLTLNDQTNLSACYQMVQTGEASVLYHADGKLCRMFSTEEIISLMEAATKFKTCHTTYCNHLNVWINRCTDIDEVSSISYGAALPEDLQKNLDTILGVTDNENTV